MRALVLFFFALGRFFRVNGEKGQVVVDRAVDQWK